MSIKDRLQASQVWRQVVNHLDYGDRMQVLAADALEEIERLEYEASYCPAADAKRHRFVDVHGVSACFCCGRPETLRQEKSMKEITQRLPHQQRVVVGAMSCRLS